MWYREGVSGNNVSYNNTASGCCVFLSQSWLPATRLQVSIWINRGRGIADQVCSVFNRCHFNQSISFILSEKKQDL